MSKYYDSQGNVVEARMISQIQRAPSFSTTTPLGASGGYTSPTVDVMNYKTYSFLMTSDQAGSYFTQYSDDGVNWFNSAAAATALTANGIGTAAGTNLLLRYIRIVYTNGATLQTTFKFSLYLSPL